MRFTVRVGCINCQYEEVIIKAPFISGFEKVKSTDNDRNRASNWSRKQQKKIYDIS